MLTIYILDRSMLLSYDKEHKGVTRGGDMYAAKRVRPLHYMPNGKEWGGVGAKNHLKVLPQSMKDS